MPEKVYTDELEGHYALLETIGTGEQLNITRALLPPVPMLTLYFLQEDSQK